MEDARADVVFARERERILLHEQRRRRCRAGFDGAEQRRLSTCVEQNARV